MNQSKKKDMCPMRPSDHLKSGYRTYAFPFPGVNRRVTVSQHHYLVGQGLSGRSRAQFFNCKVETGLESRTVLYGRSN